ncbi:hypothetical protein BH10BAC5_BH10BAC5_09820 [soil metagenome]
MKLRSLSFILFFIFIGAVFSKSPSVSVIETGMVTKRPVLKPVDLKDIEEVYTNYDYESVVKLYKPRLDDTFTITRFKYFVIFSHMSDSKTYELIDNDIRHTVEAMENNYIAVKPQAVTAVFLFNDDEVYKTFALKNFDIEEEDLSPFGFYKVSKRVILVKYISWKGSLSHEVTHSMLQDDFPDIPGWFNEGFASLHEKASYKDGKLIGDFSWRINAIRTAFKNNTYTDLNYLMNITDNELYSSNASFYYGQSRMLLSYLQDKVLLERFYKLFRDTFDADNTGISQLEKLLKLKVYDLEPLFINYVKNFDNKF